MKNPEYDTIVIGAGHAGVEASLAVSRCGFQTLLMTMDTNAVARMSCNPAIGGIAKGHMVREIDALGGEMGLAIDHAGIQFRMLNRSKGPAVWSPRAQADKEEYSRYMKQVVERQPGLTLAEAQVVRLIVESGTCKGVETKDGRRITARVVVITTGTFLQGLMHVGEAQKSGGRIDEEPAVGLSASLTENGLELVRFKTGTPPRLKAGSIDWSVLEEQKGDEPPTAFSYRTERLDVDQLSCFITHTNKKVHEHIQANLHRSPLFAGAITGTGTRYCPSIEDKIVKFSDRQRHQLYLEPEGRKTDSIYINGLSTSLPEDVQRKIVSLIPGLENAEFLRLGYAIEYDCAPPTQLWHTLETKTVQNLYLAGQINCTSGYEEAAAQGLMAGLNVVRRLQKAAPFVLDRSEAYTGVLIDDLVTRGTNEPYRMFTSRAEFRLLLRQDNADERLMQYGHAFGLISPPVFDQMRERLSRIRFEIKTLRKKHHGQVSLHRYLKRPDISYKTLINNGLHSSSVSENEAERIEAEVKYEGYIARQVTEVEKFRRLEKKRIPPRIDYHKVRGISTEAREKLLRILPESIAQAARIPGISPCDISLLAVHLEKNADGFSE